MHRFSRTHLSPEAALQALETNRSEESAKVAEVIALIAVIDARKDYLPSGYSCMQSYCRGRLRMTVDQASKRIHVARAALRCPELFEYLADGRLSVTTAAVIAPQLVPDDAAVLLASAAHRSKLELQQLLATRARAAAASPGAPESNGQIPAESHASEGAISLSNLCSAPATVPDASSHAPAHVELSGKYRVWPSPTGGFEVRLSISDNEHADLRKLQALLGHALPSGDLAQIYARAIQYYLAHLEKQRLGVKPGAAPASEPRGRGIPKALRRLVSERDGGRCSFVSADGHRCEETFRVEIDHIQPLAMGGKTTPENLRVLCRAHNQYEAERFFGKEHMQTKRELAQRARARENAAARADAAREKARKEALKKSRDAEAQARHDDLHAALRSLGYRDADARRGARLADDMPDASLEACLRRALTELSRPVALRGERMARCTA